jgi:hypothetical protein
MSGGAAAKAIARIEKIAAKEGGYPAAIDLAQYPNEATFLRVHPTESFGAHLIERFELAEWCRQRGIRVVNHTIGDAVSPSAAAEEAVRARPPYRLGLNIAASPAGRSGAALGWMVIKLSMRGKTAGGEE